MTFDASINPVAYEGGKAVFIDAEPDSWNMDPAVLEKAFELFPDKKVIMLAHHYGTPAKMDEIRAVADAHGTLFVEDAAESLGAMSLYKGLWRQTGSLGDYSWISLNGNKTSPARPAACSSPIPWRTPIKSAIDSPSPEMTRPGISTRKPATITGCPI